MLRTNKEWYNLLTPSDKIRFNKNFTKFRPDYPLADYLKGQNK